MHHLSSFLVFFLFLSSLCGAQAKGVDERREEIILRLKSQAYRAYYGKGQSVNYARALELYLLAAERGDAGAQFIAGGMLYQGQGADQNRHGGFKWLLMAAEQGKASPESLAIIGAMFLRGSTVPQNYLEAKKWLKEGARLDNLAAQNDLAYLYYNGLGGERDYKKALDLYKKAALKGDTLAQANTGSMYATGRGTAIDKARGYAWYSLATSRGNTAAAINLNNLLMGMSWQELNRAQAISLDLYRQVENLAEPKQIVPIP